MRDNSTAVAALALGLIVMALVGQCYGQLNVGFYQGKCQDVDFDVEQFIRQRVESAYEQDSTLAAAMLRMLFHDCFVRGCDASILLNGNDTEKTAGPNRTVRGYELIEDIKKAVEEICPEVVSCADIIVIVTRVTVYLASGRTNWYDVETGRRDGVISRASEAKSNLPAPDVPVPKAVSMFNVIGLSVEDFVLLMGGHTVGISHCVNFQDRLYNFGGNPGASDPSIHPKFLPVLKSTCPKNGTGGNFTNLDQITPKSVDNGYYNSIRKRHGILQIDQDIVFNPLTSSIVAHFAANKADFDLKFGVALNNLARVGCLSGTQGQIRTTCGSVRG
ncbi:hypothetical protein BVRB_4g096710 [Beta vulgaris subsp. vulgaris]|uniref:Peroxidase n=1 Tax=Beta vulgaris subsp. vulgaris TaxID=3555 RepID=A0A0J8B9J9_BETVV|nr:hypothetical protein BVRB_4g096710 [Beta vulgaris subsp. vulgaris]